MCIQDLNQHLELLNKEIEHKEFIKLQPTWDLYSLKESFKQLLEAFEKFNKTL